MVKLLGKVRYSEAKSSNDITYKAGIYLRLSKMINDEMYEESLSIYSQRLILMDWINKHDDVQFVSEYVDDGYSGTTFDRPGFKRMVEDIKNNKINCVIVKDLSRFGRNYIRVNDYILNVFPLYNVRFVSIIDNVDSICNPNSINNPLFSLINLINDEYSRDISDKLKKICKHKMEKGYAISSGGVYGYIRKHNKYFVDIEASLIVKYIFSEYEKGKTFSEIASLLNKKKIYSPLKYKIFKLYPGKYDFNSYKYDVRKAVWTDDVISNILKARVYCGDLVQGKRRYQSHKIHKVINNPESEWVIVENTHEPIIDREQFFRVQELIEKRRLDEFDSGKYNLFYRMIKCGRCGKYLIKKVRRTKECSKIFYCCQTYNRYGISYCSSHLMDGNILYDFVLKSINNRISQIKKLKKSIASIKGKFSFIDVNRLREKIELINKEILNFRNQKLKIYRKYKNGSISKDEYINQERNIEDRIKEISKVSSKIIFIIDFMETIKNNSGWLDYFSKFRINRKLKRKILEDIIGNIVLTTDSKLIIYFKYENEFNELNSLINKIDSNNIMEVINEV